MCARIVVSGGSGFVGRYFVDAATRTGHETVALSRERGDYASIASLARAMAGADAMVHAAGRAHVMRGANSVDEPAFDRGNVELTARVAEAAAQAGVRRFIFISSVAAIARSSDARLSGSETPRPDSAYGRSKLRAEEAATRILSGTGVGLVILRPPMIFGPGMRGNPLRLFKLVASRVPLPLGSIRNRRSILFVGNLSNALLRIAEAEPFSIVSFIRDTEEPSTPELVSAIANALGVPTRLLPVPPGALRAIGRLGDLLPGGLPFPLTSATVAGLVDSLLVDSTPLIGAIGPYASVSLTDSLAESAVWYRSGRR